MASSAGAIRSSTPPRARRATRAPRSLRASSRPVTDRSLAGMQVQADVPLYRQTLDFTCGPACLMMAMSHFDPDLVLDRKLELRLWRESTTVFMTNGLGGCGPVGLGLSAARRGFEAHVVIGHHSVPFLTTVKQESKREVIRLIHETMLEDAREARMPLELVDFNLKDVFRALDRGEIPILLISVYRLYGEKAPHWVVVRGYDAEYVYINDPYRDFGGRAPTWAGGRLRLPHKEFSKMKRYGQNLEKSMVILCGRK